MAARFQHHYADWFAGEQFAEHDPGEALLRGFEDEGDGAEGFLVLHLEAVRAVPLEVGVDQLGEVIRAGGFYESHVTPRRWSSSWQGRHRFSFVVRYLERRAPQSAQYASFSTVFGGLPGA